MMETTPGPTDFFKVFNLLIFGDFQFNPEKKGLLYFYYGQYRGDGLKKAKTIEEYENALKEVLKAVPINGDQGDYFSMEKAFQEIKNKNQDFFGEFVNTIDITIPSPDYHLDREQYFHLIAKESVRSLYKLKYLFLKISEDKRAELIRSALAQIATLVFYSVEKVNGSKESGFLQYASKLDTTSQIEEVYKYAYTVLVLNLVRLYKEVIYAFRPLADDRDKSISDLMGRKPDGINAKLLDQEIDFGFTILKANELAEAEHFEAINAKGLLRELYALKDHKINKRKWEEAVAALENRLFLLNWEGEMGMEKFSSPNFADVQLMEIEEKYQEEIEKLKSPKDQLEKVEILILDLKLTFEGLLPDEVVVKNSIPQSLLVWLYDQKKQFKNQIAIENAISNSGKRKDEPKSKPNSKKKKVVIESFTYKEIIKNHDKIENLRLKLIEKISYTKKSFIPQDTDKRNFRNIFSGKKIEKEKRIVWNGTEEELKYLINLMYKTHCLLEDLKLQIWEVMAKCFMKEGGLDFEWRKFHSKTKPNEESSKLLEDIVFKQFI